MKWLNEIYQNFDLENEDLWLQNNLKLSGSRSHMPTLNAFHGDENNYLYRYDGKHPSFIEETGLPKIHDFRKFY